MGPTHINFQNVIPTVEERIDLSEAEAAILSQNPVPQGVPDIAKPPQTVKVQNLRAKVDRNTMPLF